MNTLFEHTSFPWVRYSDYQWKQSEKGVLFLMPAPDATPSVYDPLKTYQRLVLDAIDIGRMGMSKKPDREIQSAILQFARNYGMFGLMTGLPTTPNFMEYESVYLPRNPFLKEETMATEAYLEIFFPFEKLDVVKRGIESAWNINKDRTMMALALTMQTQPQAVSMSFQRQYAEPYEWMKQQFINWAFTFYTCFLYETDKDTMTPDRRRLMQQGMAAFDSNAPSYHIALTECPILVWDFHSLMLGIQMMLSFMLTDRKHPIQVCKQCMKTFVPGRSGMRFCSPQCRTEYRKKNQEDDEK